MIPGVEEKKNMEVQSKRYKNGAYRSLGWHASVRNQNVQECFFVFCKSLQDLILQTFSGVKMMNTISEYTASQWPVDILKAKMWCGTDPPDDFNTRKNKHGLAFSRAKSMFVIKKHTWWIDFFMSQRNLCPFTKWNYFCIELIRFTPAVTVFNSNNWIYLNSPPLQQTKVHQIWSELGRYCITIHIVYQQNFRSNIADAWWRSLSLFFRKVTIWRIPGQRGRSGPIRFQGWNLSGHLFDTPLSHT